jgi:hypothetical protein
MINKSVFENDLVSGMLKELNANDQSKSLEKLGCAVDYLYSAMDILEDAGMTAKADEVLNILEKIAQVKHKNVEQMPSINALLENGVKNKDLEDFFKNKETVVARSRICTAYRKMGYTDKEIIKFVGKDRFVDEDTAAEWLKPETQSKTDTIAEWIEKSTPKYSPEDPGTGEQLKPGFPIKSLLDENKVSDPSHTKGLTSDKMVNNLKNHGTVFNLADDGSADTLLSDDVDMGHELLEVEEDEEDFEDED